jgi:hypothetical protein
MNETKLGRFVSPSLDIYSQILECHAIGEKASSITLKYTDVLGREIQDLLEFSLFVPDQGLCVALLTDIGHRPDKLAIAGGIP